jgi:hypothetical protein
MPDVARFFSEACLGKNIDIGVVSGIGMEEMILSIRTK